MKKETDFKKKAEDYRILLVVIIVIMVFFGGKNYIKTQNVVGQHLNTMTLAIMYGADFLAQSESEQDQKMMLEMIYNSVSDTQKSLDTVVGNSRLLRTYAYKTDELAFHILEMRAEYQDEQLSVVVEEIQNIAKAIEDSGIRKVVAREGYLYSLDSKGVKEDIDEILGACREL